MKPLLYFSFVLLVGCIRATDEMKAMSREHLALVSDVAAKVCPNDQLLLAVVRESAITLDAEINRESVDVIAGAKTVAAVASEVAPVVAASGFPCASAIGIGLLIVAAAITAAAKVLTKKSISNRGHVNDMPPEDEGGRRPNVLCKVIP